MKGYAFALGMSVFAYLVQRYRSPQTISPDGRYYMRLAQHQPVPTPYASRVLLPLLLGTKHRAWQWVTGAALIACGPLLFAATGSLGAVWFFVWLPGLFALNVRHPILVDAPALALALAAWAFCPPLGRVHGVAGGLLVWAKEVVPLFLATWSGEPAAIAVGLGLALFARTWPPVSRLRDDDAGVDWLRHPWRAARASRDPLDWRRMLLPWGSVLPLAGLGMAWDKPSFAAAASLVVGYGQLLAAQDDSRLYQWAAPAVLVLAVRGMNSAPPWVVAVLIVVHPFVCATHKGT